MKKWAVAAVVSVVAAMAASGSIAVAQSQRFSDVAADHYAFEAVEWAAEAGVTVGYGDGTFKPSRALGRWHALVFMERFYDEILKADESEDFTRGDMMVLLKAINDGTLRDTAGEQPVEVEDSTTHTGTVPTPSGAVATDRAALIALYHATDGPNWDNSDNWLTDRPLGTWHGVVPDESGRVWGLHLGAMWGPRGEPLESGNSLSGAIPPEIGNLTSLPFLDLSDNALTGAIPPEIGSLTNLEGLALQGNSLAAGPIPVEFAELGSLERLRLDVGHCAPAGLRSFLSERRLDILPCTAPDVRLLPSALLREDSGGLSVALDDDLQNPASVTVSDLAVVTAAVQDGWLVLVPEGRGEADVVIVPSGGGMSATATVVVRPAVGTFGIDVVMEQPVTDVYAETMTAAADQWSAVLNGTQWEGRDARQYCERWERDVPVAASGNELVIWATRESDPSFTAGATGWGCTRREGPDTEPSHYYPVAGIVTVNARVQGVFGDVEILRHEIGHVLGLTGGFPPRTGLVTEDWKYFVGSRAVAAFREGGGDPDLPGIPLGESHWGGASHWGYGVHGPEVMHDPRNGVDGLSVAALADAGYTVDMSKAIPWYQE